MATDYDAEILDWQTNGQAKVQAKINRLKLQLEKDLSSGMRNSIMRNLDYLENYATAYIEGVIVNLNRAKSYEVNVEE